MTPEREVIIRRSKELRRKLAQAQAEVDKIQIDRKVLVEECEHPAAYDTSHMGESCRDCPDCEGCLY